MAQKITMKLATRGQRFGAAMIDMIPRWIFTGIFTSRVVTRMAYSILNEVSYAYYGVAYGEPAKASPLWAAFALVWLGTELFLYSKGQSIGKAIVGLRVVQDRNGKPLGFWWMVLREFFIKPAGGSMLLLGYIWVLVDNYNRGWHDKILDTYVVDALVGFVPDKDAPADVAERAEPQTAGPAPQTPADQTMQSAIVKQEPQPTDISSEPHPAAKESASTGVPTIEPEESTAEIVITAEEPAIEGYDPSKYTTVVKRADE